MAKRKAGVIGRLASISPSGDEDWDAWEALDAVLGQLDWSSMRQQQALWRVLERIPEADNDFTWGILHQLESLPAYEGPLYESLKRLPTRLGMTKLRRRVNSGLVVPSYLVGALGALASSAGVVKLAQQASELLRALEASAAQQADSGHTSEAPANKKKPASTKKPPSTKEPAAKKMPATKTKPAAKKKPRTKTKPAAKEKPGA